jgi:hypothetical protein
MYIFLMILWIINSFLWSINIGKTLILAVEYWEFLDKFGRFWAIFWTVASIIMLIFSGLQATWFIIKIWG